MGTWLLQTGSRCDCAEPPDFFQYYERRDIGTVSGRGAAAAFLRYVVEEAIAGRACRIKGYSIAIEVFDRNETFTQFDRNETFTQDDPVVRIEAGVSDGPRSCIPGEFRSALIDHLA